MDDEYPKGLYRIRRPDGVEDDVQLVYSEGGFENSIPESKYHTRGYKPFLKDLPWLDEDNNA